MQATLRAPARAAIGATTQRARPRAAVCTHRLAEARGGRRATGLARDAQLDVHVGEVALAGAHAQAQARGYELVAQAVGDQRQHVELARAELVERDGRRAALRAQERAHLR